MTGHSDRETIAVVGLGYVGLPWAVEFGRVRPVIGFDIDPTRIAQLLTGRDRTGEVTGDQLRESQHLEFTSDPTSLKTADIYVVTVPTPVDQAKRPDLGPLLSATRTVGQALHPGNLVIYESTVYPGVTEEVCGPVLEETSGLSLNEDFFLGYSPERINPGDKEHRLTTITKVVSASTPAALERVDALYTNFVTAGTFRAGSIRVAEAAKIIENVQRDVNIALVNELAVLFDRLNLDTNEVLEAASTKWNFLPFQPGLVGGHCIGVDPYYLTHKAHEVGFHPEIIHAGRRINDAMGTHVADRLIQLMSAAGNFAGTPRVLVCGFAFKENCPDVRNTKVIDIVMRLENYGIDVDVCDPWVDPFEVKSTYGISLTNVKDVKPSAYSGLIFAVAHTNMVDWVTELAEEMRGSAIVFDVKARLPVDVVDGRL